MEAIKPLSFKAAVIRDATGEIYPPSKKVTLMEKLDARASKKIEVSQGTVWLLATALVLAGVVFSYGSSFVGWIRDDQDQRARTSQIQSTLEAVQVAQQQMNERMQRIERDLLEQRVSSAKADGYKLGQTDAGATGHK